LPILRRSCADPAPILPVSSRIRGFATVSKASETTQAAGPLFGAAALLEFGPKRRLPDLAGGRTVAFRRAETARRTGRSD
jgi:hypothetical protein